MTNRQVLVIDDSPEDRRVACDVLNGADYDVVEAVDGPRGLDAARTLQPACILLDHGLPDVDGLDVLRTLSIDLAWQTPVVMMTGSRDPRIGASAIKLGAEDFVVKSDIEITLLQTVRHSMERFALRRANHDAATRNCELAALASACPLALMTVSRNGEVRTWNTVAELLYGYHSDAIIGRPVETLWVSSEQEAHRILYEEAIQNPRGMESRHLREDGRMIDVSVSVAAIKQPDGSVSGFATCVEDISRRKMGERDLALSEQRLRMAAEVGRIGTFEWNIKSDVVTWSDVMAQNAGMSPGQFGGTLAAFRQLVESDDLPRVESCIARALEDEQPYEIEFRMRKPDGSIRFAQTRGAVLGDEQGAAERIFGIDMDVTSSRLAEAALRESELRLSMAQSAAKIGIWDWHILSNTTAFNSVYYELYGLPPDTPNNYADFLARVHPTDRSHVDESMKAALASERPYEAEYRIQRADDGETRWFAAKGEVLFDREEKPIRALGAVFDITERKRAEQHAKLLSGEVNHRAKNLLDVVRNVARRTAATTIGEFREKFDKRLSALSIGQDLLVRREWKGVSLEELVRTQLEAFMDIDRVRFDGPDLAINPRASECIGMSLHELATNAGKYGALSNQEGSIRISWSLDAQDDAPQRFSMTWREIDGPALDAPKHRGFGSTVLEEISRWTLSADVVLDFRPAGLVWRLSCPIDRVVADAFG
ncbi:putative Signal transduction histidine kinase [Bradyrhizobium sp. ORS 375]|uniref:PAS domain-containing protein n=1 Tax=Bradyrhizobium sp. (strain ORS 375) TaxID=566679 RepID=UPI0002408610|nr:PAS domain-containing protein [Bradyrhizobium sp. ORS 375]CCD95822.1 putative Signal transduction histidine kinase [Bradyrhizobium sp. ORS 375]